MIAFVFPGQGSQKRGMGGYLFDQVREYTDLEEEVDHLLGYSMRELCLEDPRGYLQETQYTQPSLYVVNALHYYHAVRQGVRPDYLLGHSLGEYNALLAAGVFDFFTGLRLVKKRGELMAQVSGGMAAVIGLEESRVTQVIKENGLTMLDVANFNTPQQIVISGPADSIEGARYFFEQAGAQLYMPLPVSAAFHSRYTNEAADAFADFLVPLSFSAPGVPVIANVTALPYEADSSSEAIKSMLVKQITHPLLWWQSVRYLSAKGVTEFREMGAGNILTRMIKQVTQEKLPS